jgi:hypothetical protein
MNLQESNELQYWEVWYPKAAATGLLLGRGRIDPADEILVHAPPEVLTVEVSDGRGRRLAYGKDLPQTLDSPMCRLRRAGERITREDFWPTEADLGRLVLLPGGEVGTLIEWWHAPDRKEWRWRVEFYNSIR